MKLSLTLYSLFLSGIVFGQGILNNGARIVTSGAAQIYIDGNNAGDYKSQAGGQIDPSAGMIWTMEGDWVNNSANTGFGFDAGTVVLNDAAQTIGGSNPTTFYNLTLQGTGTKTQLINTFVGGVTTRTGIFSIGSRIYDLNSFRLTVTNPATTAVTYGAGYVLSETNLAVNPSYMNWYMGTTTGTFIYPFGVAGLQIPFTFNKTTASSSSVAISTRATNASDNLPWAGLSNVAAVTTMFSPVIGGDGSIPVVIDRWWDITSAAPVTANCTFSYRGIENTLTPPYNTGNLGAQHWNGAGWDPPVGSTPAVLAGVGTATANGLSTFSPWILSSLNAPLPIELVDFSVKCAGRNQSLSWITASEKNNDFFTIEKSYDGKTFSFVANVKGAGNSNSYKTYNYTDNNSNSSEIIYYRISQTDFDETKKICKTIVTQPCSSSGKDITINNTGDGAVFVNIASEFDNNYQVTVYDVLGRALKAENWNITKGYVTNRLNTEGLSEAYYMLLIQDLTDGSNIKTQRVYINNHQF